MRGSRLSTYSAHKHLPRNSQAEQDRPAVFYLILQVWGDTYTRTLIDFALPALLSPGNIPALAASAPTILKLYTTECDLARIKGSPSFELLRSSVTIRYHSLDSIPDGDRYAAMTAIHREVVREAFDEHAALVWLLPDTIWADGALSVVAAQAAAGKRMVMQAGIRVTKSTALPALNAMFHGQPAVTVKPCELVKLALDHMHPYNRAWYWDAPSFNRNPANVYWRVGHSGLLIRGFHLHALMMFPERRVDHFVSTFDDDLPLLACPSRESIYVATDSDGIFHVDLADDDWHGKVLMLDRPPSAAYLATWAYGGSNLHHRWFADSKIRVHSEPVDERWAPVERESDRILNSARRWLAGRYVAVSALARVAGVSRAEILDNAPHKLGWELLPPRKAWVLRWSAFFEWAGAPRVARLPDTFYQFAFRHTLYGLYGKNVTVRALGLDLQIAKPWRRRLHAWWRQLTWRAAAHIRLKRLRSEVRRRSSMIRKRRHRTVKQLRHVLTATPDHLRKRIRRAGRTWVRGRERGSRSRAAR